MPRSPSPGRDRKRRHDERDSRDSKRARGEDREEGRDRRQVEDIREDRRDKERSDWRRRSRSRDREDRRRERSRSRSRDRRHRSRSRDRDRDRSDRRDRDRERERESGRERDRGSDRGPDRAGSDRDGGVGRAADRGGAGQLPGPPGSKEDEEQEANGDLNGNGNHKPKAAPLSLEELLRKKKEQQEQESKPKFLTKAERAALALQRRQEETVGIRAQQEEMRRLQQAQQQDELRRLEAERREAERNRHKDEREREKELELIRKQYLGGDREKKKVMKASEKFRFNFDWDNKEDTSRDLNPLYNNLHQANLLFGRGMLAGIDRREQKKQSAVVEADMLRKLREGAGISETAAMRQEEKDRRERADKYGAGDMRVDTHWSEKPLHKMTERDWRIFREDFNIAYKGNANTLPLRNWEEALLPEPINMAIEYVGYAKPSPIQMASIPLGLKQLDVIGVAETGSGKTAAFVIPMLAYIMKQPPMTEANSADGPYAVVLAPTRELAQQIEEETLKLAKYTDFKVTSVVGGQSIEEQGSKLRRGCEIVIATPGRLLDCIERHYCVLNQCNYVVLDEADRMIDLGFEPQVQAVLDAMPHSSLKPEDEAAELDEKRTYRTTYMFSATMPPAVERLARKYLRRPVVVNIGRAGMATDNVTQRVIMVKENEKPHRLSSELDMIHEKKVIVFVNTKRQCDNVYGQLEAAGYSCTVLHGGRTQDQRELSIKGFKEDTYNVLIATDVAGRGIDVPDVALVVNYDMPNNIEAYTHRIGRTGRAGRKGTAITFLAGHDSEVFYDLKKLLEESKAVVPPELARSEAAKMKPGSINQKRDSVVYAKK